MVLESAEAKEKERVWVKGRTTGEFDDARLIDGVCGEQNVISSGWQCAVELSYRALAGLQEKRRAR